MPRRLKREGLPAPPRENVAPAIQGSDPGGTTHSVDCPVTSAIKSVVVVVHDDQAVPFGCASYDQIRELQGTEKCAFG